jgi:outer membrane protein W
LKKLVALFVIVAAFLSLNSSTFSQPQLTIHVKGAYDLPLPDLKGDMLDSADQINTLGMKLGYGFGADAKYYLGKKRNVGITLDLGYQMFSNSEDTVGGPGLVFSGKDVKTSLNAFNFGVGVEYNFMPKGKAKPFIGAEFTGHILSGKITGSPLTGNQNELTMKSASRFGAAFGAGVDIAFNKSIGMVIGAKYHLANLIGKEGLDTAVVGSSTEYQFVDDEFTVGGTTFEAKNMSYIQAYLGVSFFLNQPKKTVKK